MLFFHHSTLHGISVVGYFIEEKTKDQRGSLAQDHTVSEWQSRVPSRVSKSLIQSSFSPGLLPPSRLSEYSG